MAEQTHVPGPDPKTMTLAEAEAEVKNAVYKATRLIEQLEMAGKISGNGHHKRQRVAEAAAQELRDAWLEPTVLCGEVRDPSDPASQTCTLPKGHGGPHSALVP